MEELREKANCYAEENVVSILKEAIAKSYADGYRDGYKDREEKIPVDLRNNTTEFVDLGLPSGTLWAKRFERVEGERLFLPYDKAKEMSIPTIEQYQELLGKCRWSFEDESAYCTGPNGNVISFVYAGFIRAKLVEKDSCFNSRFWLASNDENGDGRKAAYITLLRYNNQLEKRIEDYFSGYKLPIRLVKSK